MAQLIGGKYDADKLFQECKHKLLQDMDTYKDQLMAINMGACSLDQKWRTIEEIEKGVHNILPNLDTLGDEDEIAIITYDYYLTLNKCFRKHHGFDQ